MRCSEPLRASALTDCPSPAGEGSGEQANIVRPQQKWEKTGKLLQRKSSRANVLRRNRQPALENQPNGFRVSFVIQVEGDVVRAGSGETGALSPAAALTLTLSPGTMYPWSGRGEYCR